MRKNYVISKIKKAKRDPLTQLDYELFSAKKAYKSYLGLSCDPPIPSKMKELVKLIF